MFMDIEIHNIDFEGLYFVVQRLYRAGIILLCLQIDPINQTMKIHHINDNQTISIYSVIKNISVKINLIKFWSKINQQICEMIQEYLSIDEMVINVQRFFIILENLWKDKYYQDNQTMTMKLQTRCEQIINRNHQPVIQNSLFVDLRDDHYICQSKIDYEPISSLSLSSKKLDSLFSKKILNKSKLKNDENIINKISNQNNVDLNCFTIKYMTLLNIKQFAEKYKTLYDKNMFLTHKLNTNHISFYTITFYRNFSIQITKNHFIANENRTRKISLYQNNKLKIRNNSGQKIHFKILTNLFSKLSNKKMNQVVNIYQNSNYVVYDISHVFPNFKLYILNHLS